MVQKEATPLLTNAMRAFLPGLPAGALPLEELEEELPQPLRCNSTNEHTSTRINRMEFMGWAILG
jgi:hypothetical protein